MSPPDARRQVDRASLDAPPDIDERLTAIDAPTFINGANQTVLDFGVVPSAPPACNLSLTAVNDPTVREQPTAAAIASPSPGQKKVCFSAAFRSSSPRSGQGIDAK